MSDLLDSVFSSNFAKNVATAGLSEIEASVIKATYEDNDPPKEKHVLRLIQSIGPGRFPQPVQILFKRVVSSNWRIVLKSFVVFHRLMRDADESLMTYLSRHTHAMQQAGTRFHDPSAVTLTAFIHRYSAYLVAKLNTYNTVKYQAERHTPTAAREWSLRLSLAQVMKSLPYYQSQLDKLLEVEPELSKDSEYPAVRAAMLLLLRDSLRLVVICTMQMSQAVNEYQQLDVKGLQRLVALIEMDYTLNEAFRRWAKVVEELKITSDPLPRFSPISEIVTKAIFDKLSQLERSNGHDEAATTETLTEGKDSKDFQRPGTRSTVVTERPHSLVNGGSEGQSNQASAAALRAYTDMVSGSGKVNAGTGSTNIAFDDDPWAEIASSTSTTTISGVSTTARKNGNGKNNNAISIGTSQVSGPSRTDSPDPFTEIARESTHDIFGGSVASVGVGANNGDDGVDDDDPFASIAAQHHQGHHRGPSQSGSVLSTATTTTSVTTNTTTATSLADVMTPSTSVKGQTNDPFQFDTFASVLPSSSNNHPSSTGTSTTTAAAAAARRQSTGTLSSLPSSTVPPTNHSSSSSVDVFAGLFNEQPSSNSTSPMNGYSTNSNMMVMMTDAQRRNSASVGVSTVNGSSMGMGMGMGVGMGMGAMPTNPYIGTNQMGLAMGPMPGMPTLTGMYGHGMGMSLGMGSGSGSNAMGNTGMMMANQMGMGYGNEAMRRTSIPGNQIQGMGMGMGIGMGMGMGMGMGAMGGMMMPPSSTVPTTSTTTTSHDPFDFLSETTSPSSASSSTSTSLTSTPSSSTATNTGTLASKPVSTSSPSSRDDLFEF